MKRQLIILACCVVTLAVTACSKEKVSVSAEDLATHTSVSAEGNFAEAIAEAEEHWSHRESEEEAQAAIDAWERAVTYDTGDADRKEALFKAYTDLAHGYYWLSHGHKFFISKKKDRKEAQQAAFKKCMKAGLVALSIHNDQWKDSFGNDDIEKSVTYLTKEDVPAAYWYATCTGKWATLEGISTLLAYKDQIFSIVTRLAELDEAFYYNATDRYFGVVYTKLPFSNPDLEKSASYFIHGVEAHPDYLETRVLFVEELLTKVGDSKSAREQLEFVVNADPKANPDVYPENLAAQRHAQDMLDNWIDYFYE